MGFPGYFLIVQDFIAAARKMVCSRWSGRGSVAGSAVAYCLGITDIDPIKYDFFLSVSESGSYLKCPISMWI